MNFVMLVSPEAMHRTFQGSSGPPSTATTITITKLFTVVTSKLKMEVFETEFYNDGTTLNNKRVDSADLNV